MDTTDHAPGLSSRRRFLAGAGLGGMVVTIGGSTIALSTLFPAGAQEEEGDLAADTVAFLQSLELALATSYEELLAAGKVTSPAAAQAIRTYAAHHREHAGALAGLAGGRADGQPTERLVRTIADQVALVSTEAAALRIVIDLENAAASSHLSALDNVDDAAVGVVASILPIESKHATALAQAAGVGLSNAVPAFENLDLGLDATRFSPTTTTSTTA